MYAPRKRMSVESIGSSSTDNAWQIIGTPSTSGRNHR
jgi:hypothetical protein